MDYEKKYNEALERARKIHDEIVNNEVIGFPGQITDIFPELSESEDERIRKWLVDYFGSIKETVWIHRDITCKQILAYLEKQKEQKPTEKQDYSGLTDLERAIHRGFLCAGVENVSVTIIKETAQDCIAHMPAEWSEEDEKIIDTIVSVLGQYIDYKAVSGTGTGYATPRYSKEIDWLKSLRPGWKPTEEQMEALEIIVRYGDKESTHIKSLTSLYEQLKQL